MEKELLQLIQIQTKYFNERKKDYKEINQEKTNTLNVMLRISENNIIKKFIDEEFENIISTLKKYQNKRIGEKTGTVSSFRETGEKQSRFSRISR